MRRRALAWSITAAVLILALAVAIRVHRESEQPQASPTGPVKPQCATVKTTDSTGAPLLDNFLTKVVTVHKAACGRDYDGLLAMMESPFGRRPPSEALDELRADDGAPLVVLAQTLETAPISGQGGLVYCHPHGAVAIFARGTLDRPGRWTSFTLTGDRRTNTDCFELRPERPSGR